MNFFERADMVLGEVREALRAVDEESVGYFIKAILDAEKVFAIGVGRVMLSLQAMVKRLNHLGIKAHCVGDIDEPPITGRDLLIVGSGSGESVVPLSIARVAKKYKAKIAYLGSNSESSVCKIADIFVRIPVRTKLELPGEIPSKQMMTNLFEQALYIFGDIVTTIIAEQKNLDKDSLWKSHANLE